MIKLNNIDGKQIKNFLINNAIYIVLLLIILLIVGQDPSFLRIGNFKNILTQSAVRIIIALGVAGLIVTQGTDLSAGRMVGLAAVISASLLQSSGNANRVFTSFSNLPLIVVVLVVCIVGCLFGLLNGVVISKLKVTPFIATLGMMIIVYGTNSLYYDKVARSAPVAGLDPRYTQFVQGFIDLKVFTIPYLIIYAFIAIAITWFIWNKTIFGKNIFAVGGNPEAAVVSGVNVTITLLIVYGMSGMFYGFAGFLEAARVGSATNNMGFLYELDAIAACVVGGVSFSGGVGKVSGVVIGVIMFTLINYGLTYIGVQPYWQQIIRGVIIIVAVAMDTIKYNQR